MTTQHHTQQDGFDVAVVGATGLVGRTMISVLQERRFPVRRLLPFASARSAGSTVDFGGRSFPVQALTEESIRSSSPQIALFSAGASVSRQYGPIAADAGAFLRELNKQLAGRALPDRAGMPSNCREVSPAYPAPTPIRSPDTATARSRRYGRTPATGARRVRT